MGRVRVKICGITNLEDALQAVEAGADALGFVFHSPSPRAVTPEQARLIAMQLPPLVTTVGLFVNQSPQQVGDILTAAGLDVAQLHGDESPGDCRIAGRRVIKALRVRDLASLRGAEDYPVAALLLDAWSDAAYGGTGATFDWRLAAELTRQRPLILAGGLTPGNVAAAIDQVRPYAVDVSSGVERRPGCKDHTLVSEFIQQVRTS